MTSPGVAHLPLQVKGENCKSLEKIMKQSTQLILLLVGLLVVFTAIFLLLDFRLLQGQMAVNSSASTFASSVDEQSRFPLNQDVDLYVQAPQEFENKLVGALREALQTNPYLGEINPEIDPELNPDAEPLLAAEGSVLVIEIEDPTTFFWTPFYARSETTVQVAYASDGEVTWIGEDTVVFETTDPP